MHRSWLQRRLRDYLTRYPREAATVARFERFVAAHDDCFERRCVPGHVTGSAWVLDASGERVLLTHHRKLGRWLQLGGHSDGDPCTLRVALREAGEESGLPVRALDEAIFDLDAHVIPARGNEPEHVHYDVRFLIAARSDAFVVSDESHALAWIALEEVAALSDEASLLRMVHKTRVRTTG